MNTKLVLIGMVMLGLLVTQREAQPHGFGGARGGGGAGGASRGGGSYSYNREYSGSHGGSASVEGSGSAAYGPRGGAASGSRDVTATGPQGRSYSSDSSYGGATGPRGTVAGGSRETTATGADGRTYSGGSSGFGAVGAGGNTAIGGSRYGTASGPGGTVSGGSRYGAASGNYGAAAGGSRYGAAYGSEGSVAGASRYGAATTTRFPTDPGLANYSSAGAVSANHSTAFWSHSDMGAQGDYTRANFNNYSAFTPSWNTAHPGAWAAAGYSVGSASAWTPATWSSVSSFCSLPATPTYYDYGNNIVYQGSNIVVNGGDPQPADQYAQQVAAVANQGRTSEPAKDDKWQPFGVFALIQGTEKTSNNLFQLAVNSAGVIRGNYYDGLKDATTPVYGAVDKKTQQAAWSIGDNKNTVFETGAYNLTKDETAVLVHLGKDKTQQWMLARVQQPQQQ